MQLDGGYGYIREATVERRQRDISVHRVLKGIDEIMRLIIDRQPAPGMCLRDGDMLYAGLATGRIPAGREEELAPALGMPVGREMRTRW